MEKNKTQVCVVYPVYFSIEDFINDDIQLKKLFKKIQRKAATHPELDEFKDKIKEFADKLFPVSSITSVIHECDIQELVD